MAELKAQKREVFGRKLKKLREEGFVPAELYGRGIENIHLSIPVDEFVRVYGEAGEHAIINVDIGGKKRPALIHEVQRHPITEEVLNVDFYQVRMDEKVTTHIPLKFEGESQAVKDLSGVLVKALNEIEVEALPADIPDSVTVDLTTLDELEKSIYVRDLPKGEKFEFIVDPETVVASVSAQKEEEEPEEELTPEDVVVEGEEGGEGDEQEESGDRENEPPKEQGGGEKQNEA